ncbi:hypothetical protein [Pacificoceanicola onchidii]|uniref:hypothetical protein n=1 Tax=Pacificoceanicola onchidii TaxID=2562685 RepID=UPI0010A65C44|nr:hypothetical protein [Pacificoceanicola onchidii]
MPRPLTHLKRRLVAARRLSALTLALSLCAGGAQAATYTLEASGRLSTLSSYTTVTKTGDSESLFSRIDQAAVAVGVDPLFQAVARPTSVAVSTSVLEENGSPSADASTSNIPVHFTNLGAHAGGASFVDVYLNFSLAGLFNFPPDGGTFTQATGSADYRISLASSADFIVTSADVDFLVNRRTSTIDLSGDLIDFALDPLTSGADTYGFGGNIAVPVRVDLASPTVFVGLEVGAFSFKVGGGYSQVLASLNFVPQFATLEDGTPVAAQVPISSVPLGASGTYLIALMLIIAFVSHRLRTRAMC